MREVFDAANIAPEDYDWYLSDIETNWTPLGFSPIDQWFSGEALASFLCQHQLQFIWVFSAVPKGFRSLPLNAPYVEGNPHYWNGSVVEPQLEGGIFEIACWDSSAIILINLPALAEQAFMSKFAHTRLLATARA
jgi:hypothetical protein